jgi:hypothetical protein
MWIFKGFGSGKIETFLLDLDADPEYHHFRIWFWIKIRPRKVIIF